MPPATIYDCIAQMRERVSTGKSRQVSQRIQIYSHGLHSKFRQVEFAFYQLKTLLQIEDASSSTGEITFGIDDRIHFHVDTFFAVLYSALDVLAQIINQTVPLGLDERAVSFKKAEETLRQTHIGTLLQRHVSGVVKANRFKDLDRYRNCSTHRRQIYIQTVTVTHTPGYATGPLSTVKRFLCDDPLTLNPKVKKQREIADYCQEMIDWAGNQITKVLTNM